MALLVIVGDVVCCCSLWMGFDKSVVSCFCGEPAGRNKKKKYGTAESNDFHFDFDSDKMIFCWMRRGDFIRH